MIKKINWLHSYAVLAVLTYSLTGTAADINQINTTAQEQIRSQERLNQLRQQQVTNAASTVGSINGDVNINAGKHYKLAKGGDRKSDEFKRNDD